MNFLRTLCQKHLQEYMKCYSLRHLSVEAQNKTEFDYFSRKFEEIDVNSFGDIIESNRSDDKIRKRIETVLNEYKYEKEATLKVPTTLTTEQMKELLELQLSFERKKYFHFLYAIEAKKLQREVEKMNRKPVKDLKPIGVWDENNELIYGFRHNSMFQSIRKPSLNRRFVPRLLTAAQFGQKLVIDLDFDKYMKRFETRCLLKQLAFLYYYNKYETIEPFDLHFVNCDAEEITIKEMSRYIPNFNRSDFLVTIHYNKSYLDVFPKEKLIYLSPHSEETLTAVSDDDIYIIGGLIDKSYRAPITGIKAQEDGIRSAKLPINSHVKWVKGSTHLCINQVLAILHDWKITKDWEKTLKKNLPNRKICSEDEINWFKTKEKISKYI